MRRIVTTCLFLLSLLPFFFSCPRIPPFNQELSLSQLTASKLNSAADLGPFSFPIQGNDGKDEIFFIPGKENKEAGFIVNKWKSEFKFIYVTGEGILSDDYTEGISTLNYNNRNWLLETITGLPGYLLFIKYHENLSGPDYFPAYSLIRYDSGTNSLSPAAGGDLAGIIKADFTTSFANWGGEDPLVRGAYYSSYNNVLFFLCYHSNGTVSGYYECNYTIDAAGLTPNPLTTRGDVYIDLNLSYTKVFYYYDVQNDRSFFSTLDDNADNNYWWDDGLVPENITGTSGSIDFLLSGSRFLTFLDGQTEFRNRSGELLHTFSRWNIHIPYEQFEDNYKTIFTHTHVLYGDENKYFFKVYSLPTDEINTL